MLVAYSKKTFSVHILSTIISHILCNYQLFQVYIGWSHAVKEGTWYLLKKMSDVNQLVIFDMLLL